MSKSCFGCVHQNIQERSHEWIECKCKLDGVWRDPFGGCERHEESVPIEVIDMAEGANNG